MSKKRSFTILGALMFLCMVVSLPALFARARSSKQIPRKPTPNTMDIRQVEALQDKVSVINRTSGLTIVDARRKDGRVEITLRNDYAEPVSAYVIFAGSYSIATDFYNQEPIAPGATYVDRVLTPNSVVTVNAAVFPDGRGDGEEKYINQIVQERRGELAQRRRIHPLVRNLSMVEDTRLAPALERLRAEIAALPETYDNADPDTAFWFAAGLHNAKESHRQQVEHIQKLLTDRADMSKIRLELAERTKQNQRAISALMKSRATR